MAYLIPPHGRAPRIVLDYEEALSLLALLNANPRYWNNSLRKIIAEYVERMPKP